MPSLIEKINTPSWRRLSGAVTGNTVGVLTVDIGPREALGVAEEIGICLTVELVGVDEENEFWIIGQA